MFYVSANFVKKMWSRLREQYGRIQLKLNNGTWTKDTLSPRNNEILRELDFLQQFVKHKDSRMINQSLDDDEL